MMAVMMTYDGRRSWVPMMITICHPAKHFLNEKKDELLNEPFSIQKIPMGNFLGPLRDYHKVMFLG